MSSLSVDQRLVVADLVGTLAHAKALQRAGLLSSAELETIAAAIQTLYNEYKEGVLALDPSLEDVHTNIHSHLMSIAGDIAKKIHAGRSRNDQVVLDLRLHARSAIEGLMSAILHFQKVLISKASLLGEAVMPGYTHLQPAQPVLASHYLLAHFWRLSRDFDRLYDCFTRTNVSPLGAGALAGSSLPLEPKYVAALLGFGGVFHNSIDAVSDRDFALELLSDIAILSVHLSSLAEEIVLFSTAEYGFVKLGDQSAAGSSMMPQKRNPDMAELVRGTTGRLVGDLVSLLVALKGLPLAYNRDLQEDKQALFDAIDRVTQCVSALATVVEALTFNKEAMEAAAEGASVSTDLVEYLIKKGVSQVEAYEKIQAWLSKRDTVKTLADVTLTELKEISNLFEEDALSLLTARGSVCAKLTHGSTSPTAVAMQLEDAEATIGRELYYLGLASKHNIKVTHLIDGDKVEGFRPSPSVVSPIPNEPQA